MKVAKKIGVNVLVRASAKGGSGVYLYIPRDHADVYGIKSGNKVEIRLLRIFEEAPDKPSNTEDLSEMAGKTGRKKKVK